jgi:hypothetical protein
MVSVIDGFRLVRPSLVGKASRPSLLRSSLLLLLVLLLLPGRSTLEAQMTPVGNRGEDPDFLFRRPMVSIMARGGVLAYRADGTDDLFAFARERFTLDGSDFRAVSIGIEVGVWLGSRGELTAALDGSRVTSRSEVRDWVELDGSPIRQTTQVAQGPALSVGLRGYLFERGEELGRFVWIPRNWNAFLGGGVGVTGYRFEQWGDFVDERDGSIFTTSTAATGSPFLSYLSAGGELRMTPRISLLFEGRHQWARADMPPHHSGFDPVDLSGTRLTAGVSYQF